MILKTTKSPRTSIQYKTKQNKTMSHLPRKIVFILEFLTITYNWRQNYDSIKNKTLKTSRKETHEPRTLFPAMLSIKCYNYRNTGLNVTKLRNTAWKSPFWVIYKKIKCHITKSGLWNFWQNNFYHWIYCISKSVKSRRIEYSCYLSWH